MAGVSAKLEKIAAAASSSSCGSCNTVKSSEAVYKIAHSWEEIDRAAAPTSASGDGVMSKNQQRKLNNRKQKGVVKRFHKGAAITKQPIDEAPEEEDDEVDVTELTPEGKKLSIPYLPYLPTYLSCLSTSLYHCFNLSTLPTYLPPYLQMSSTPPW